MWESESEKMEENEEELEKHRSRERERSSLKSFWCHFLTDWSNKASFTFFPIATYFNLSFSKARDPITDKKISEICGFWTSDQKNKKIQSWLEQNKNQPWLKWKWFNPYSAPGTEPGIEDGLFPGMEMALISS